MKQARPALVFLLILSTFISIVLFLQYFELNQEIDELGNRVYGNSYAAIEAAEARMEKSAIEDGLMITLPIFFLALVGLLLSFKKYHITGVIITLLAVTSCKDDLHTTKVQYFGCDVADKTYSRNWTIEDVQKGMFFENPTFCDSIIVTVDDSLAYKQTRRQLRILKWIKSLKNPFGMENEK